MFDTDYAIQKIISETGIPEQQARSFVRLVVDAQIELATKHDLEQFALASKHDLEAVRLELVNSITLLDKTTSLKFAGLYALMLIIAGGVAKLVFYP